MYVPKSFEMNDKEQIQQFIREHSFGILVSEVDGSPFATHLSFMLREENDELIAHMAKANPQWRAFDQREVLVIFQGPHCYISPTWYQEKNTVPTWNYVTVHAYGTCQIMIEPSETLDAIRSLTHHYEGRIENSTYTEPDETVMNGLLNGVVAFKIKINRLEGKWKLNQNHSISRRKRVLEALQKQEEHHFHEIAYWMKKTMSDGEK